MKTLRKISNFTKVIVSMVVTILGVIFLLGCIWEWNVEEAILGVCLLILSDTTWLYYKDSIRDRRNEK